MNISSFIEKIRELISKGELDSVIQLLNEFLKDSPKLDEAVLQSGRYHDVMKQIRSGTIDHDKAVIRVNKIRSNLLDLLHEIEEQEKDPVIGEELKKHFISGKLFQYVEEINKIGKDLSVNHIPHATEMKVPKYLSSIHPSINLKGIVGREGDLKEVKQRFESEGQILLIQSMSGMGKTTLAMAFVKTYEDEYDHIVWVDAGGSVSAGLAGDKRLAINLGIEDIDPKELADEVLTRLQNLAGKNLLVIDNLDEQTKVNFSEMTTAKNWHTLITSRKLFDQNTLISVYRLDALSPENAEVLFHKHFTGNAVKEELQSLFNYTGYNTLVIELLAKTLDHHFQLKSVKALNQYLKDYKLSHLEVDIPTAYNQTEATRQIYTILLGAFQLTNLDEQEQWLMKQFAILPSEFFPISPFLDDLQIEEEDQLKYSNQINKLVGKGWLEKDPEGRVRAHPLIRDVAFYQLKPIYEDCVGLVDTYTKRLYLNQEKGNPVDRFQWEPFGASIVRALHQENTTVTVLRSNLALVYKDLGEYAKAAQLLEQALESDLQHFGELHPNVAIRKSNLALVYKDLGEYAKAAQLLEQALELAKEHFGELHPNVTMSKSNLAVVYQDLGEYTKAAQLLEQALESDLQHFGQLHPNVARSKSNLALVYQDLGEYAKAAQLLEQALESDLQHFGQLHPNVARSKSNLALVYRDLGEYAKAAQLLKQSFDVNLQLFGEPHPNVTRSKSNLALVYKDLGEYAKAAQLLEEALESTQQHFGELHPNVARSKSNLALVYKDLGEYAKAAELLEQALESAKQHFGELHPNVAVRKSSLAIVYQDLGEYTKAAQLLEQALASDLEQFGEQHPNVATSKSNLAVIFKDLGEYTKATQLLEQALASDLQNFGELHPKVAKSKFSLAIVYQDLGEYTKAAQLLKQALELDIQNLGKLHPNVARGKSKLASVYIGMNKLEESEPLLNDAYQIYYNLFGPNHPNAKNVRAWQDHLKKIKKNRHY